MARKVKKATLATDKGEMSVSPAQLRKIIEDENRKKRAGTHIADGVMWCPNCGGKPVTSGHASCRDCDPTQPMTPEEFRAYKAKTEKEQAEQAERAKEIEIDDDTEAELDEDAEDEDVEDEDEGEDEKE